MREEIDAEEDDPRGEERPAEPQQFRARCPQGRAEDLPQRQDRLIRSQAARQLFFRRDRRDDDEPDGGDAAQESLDDPDGEEEPHVGGERHQHDQDGVGDQAALEEGLGAVTVGETAPERRAEGGGRRGGPQDEPGPAQRGRLIHRADRPDVERQEHEHEIERERHRELRCADGQEVPATLARTGHGGGHGRSYTTPAPACIAAARRRGGPSYLLQVRLDTVPGRGRCSGNPQRSQSGSGAGRLTPPCPDARPAFSRRSYPCRTEPSRS